MLPIIFFRSAKDAHSQKGTEESNGYCVESNWYCVPKWVVSRVSKAMLPIIFFRSAKDAHSQKGTEESNGYCVESNWYCVPKWVLCCSNSERANEVGTPHAVQVFKTSYKTMNVRRLSVKKSCLSEYIKLIPRKHPLVEFFLSKIESGKYIRKLSKSYE